jgi:hypothetical protein
LELVLELELALDLVLVLVWRVWVLESGRGLAPELVLARRTR